jgi:MGT family glycosyltransferase
MANIAFFIDHEEGHLIPTFPLARQLEARGHKVVYLTLADGVDLVRRNGFACTPVLEDRFPLGSLATARTGSQAEGAPVVPPTPEEEVAGRIKAYEKFLDALVKSPELARAVAELASDLFLVSNIFVLNALVLRLRFDKPVALVSAMLMFSPRVNDVREAEAILMQTRAAAAFFQLMAKARPRARRLSEVTGELLGMRELILCPRELEIPDGRPPDPERHYVEGFIGSDRAAEQPEAFPWERLDPAKRLLLVSMGSQAVVGREVMLRFFRAVAAAVAEEPGWQLVLATGSLDGAADFPPLPADAITRRWIPQLALLQRAALMINHAGLGTIKGALAHGVPMLVFPIAREQPDNALRVVHHGLGLAGDVQRVTAAELREMIRRAAGDPEIRANVLRMGQRFREIDGSGIGVRLIEELLPPDAPAASG